MGIACFAGNHGTATVENHHAIPVRAGEAALGLVREGLPDHDRVIVGLEAETEMAGRPILVLQKAGDQTLASRLTKEGPCGMELLAYARMPE